LKRWRKKKERIVGNFYSSHKRAKITFNKLNHSSSTLFHIIIFFATAFCSHNNVAMHKKVEKELIYELPWETLKRMKITLKKFHTRAKLQTFHESFSTFYHKEA
jgi:hypothetical protein